MYYSSLIFELIPNLLFRKYQKKEWSKLVYCGTKCSLGTQTYCWPPLFSTQKVTSGCKHIRRAQSCEKIRELAP